MLVVHSYKERIILCVFIQWNTIHAYFYLFMYFCVYIYEWEKDAEDQSFWWCKM